jgi:hypothetical protein
MLTFKQYITQRRKETAQACNTTISHVAKRFPDTWYHYPYIRYVEALAQDKETRCTTRFLDQYEDTFGVNALRVLIKFHQHIVPDGYVDRNKRDIDQTYIKAKNVQKHTTNGYYETLRLNQFRRGIR